MSGTRRSWPARISRVLRHRWWDEADVRRALPPAALDRLQARIAESERLHSGEIRICVEAGLPLSYLWRDTTARERAVAVFGKLRVWDTEANNGVLIYLLLAERAIELVADRGLARVADEATWRAIVGRLSHALHAGQFEDGLRHAVDEVDALLRGHFPLAPGAVNANELPDRPHLL
ncbi:TPM domain-containing protein [Ideonella sp.]|uniref:TPM domain-containing protein n=1 Tax=Ideonella sp. TaxID=1929293 RepID=UPI002B496453|nr:TPM domain-containing protein [Ideonella sp.]HJV70457.1 TPM domain-containing protein [Ideonella sp.]